MAKILVIDDEEIIRRRICDLLELDEFTPLAAADGKTGLEIFKDENPAVVLLDLKMPGIDGLEVLDEIKKVSPTTEVIIITGHGGVEAAIQALRRDAFSYIQKPLEYDELEIEIQRALEKQQLRQKLAQSEKMAAVGEMAAGIMHSINNPNAFISGNVDFLKKVWERHETDLQQVLNDSVADELPRAIDAIATGSERIKTIVQKIKLFSRRKFAPGRQERFDLRKIFRDAANIVSQSNSDQAEEILNLDLPARKDESEERFEVYGDSSEFQEMIANLLENALDAVEDQAEPEVNCSIEFDSGEIQLNVIDNGCGIPPDIQEKIFDPFFTTKPTSQGTGLGMSIVQGIADRAGGEIEVDSEPGEGTKITLSVPSAASK